MTVQTAMIESRFLAGARRLYRTFKKDTDAAVDPLAFLRAKTLEMRQRHIKYEDTPYALEPNCKESPGGLRDLQVVIWVARAAGLGRNWTELHANGLLTPYELRRLQRHEGTIKLIRARLHAIANRREDRLVFDLQTAVAESFGLKPAKGQRISEALMHRYYWAAKAVSQLNKILMLNIEERLTGSENQPMRPINERFLDRGGLLEVARDDLYLTDRSAILETFLIYQQTPGIKALSARTLRALYNARDAMDGDVPARPGGARAVHGDPQAADGPDPRLPADERDLGARAHAVGVPPHRGAHAARPVPRVHGGPAHPDGAAQRAALLHSRARARVPVLFAARVAVGQAVDPVRGGAVPRRGQGPRRRPLHARRLAKCGASAASTRSSKDDASLIEFLVRHHLTMSHIAQKEDLSDPDVIMRFAKTVDNPRRLAALYLLTVADIRGTSPKVWNAWKGKLLEDLYRLTLRVLGGAPPNMDAEVEARKLEARNLLALRSALPGTEKPLWDTLEISYFARHDAMEIAWHARSLWRHVKTAVPVVSARAVVGGRRSAGAGVCARPARPVRAHLRLLRRRRAVDPGRQDPHQPHRLRARHVPGAAPGVRRRRRGRLPRPDLADRDRHGARRCRPRARCPSRAAAACRAACARSRSRRACSLRPDERAQHWILSVSASDRSGLLYGIARVLARHRVNLQLAKISTLGERVEDTFLVEGAALQHNRAQLQIESELLDAIAPVAPAAPATQAVSLR